MIDFEGHRVVDLSPRMIARITRIDGTVEKGNRDVFGLPWILEEGHAEYDDTYYNLVGGREGEPKWPIGRISSHCGGSHIEGGKGHLDHWEGLPDNVLGLWEYPLDTFFGPAAVCYFDNLAPVEGENDEGEKVMVGQPILPEHMPNVQKGDIVIMGSPYEGDEQPTLPRETSKWLADTGIKMLAVGFNPGVMFESDFQAPAPHNSPTHRNMLGNNIPICYPLANVDQIGKDRAFFIGLPLSVERLDATWTRALAFVEK
jgi:kynurenine formamidase